jgi:hypothetical protein
MSKVISRAAIAALVSLPLIAAATQANASCQSRKNTGTVIGGIGGALLGNSISHGGGGAVVGGLGGAVVGHEVAKGGCKRVVYRNRPATSARAGTPRPAPSATRTYYDQYGRPVTPTQARYPSR